MNFQNIPRSVEQIKSVFVPKLDAFVFADYSQIELRLLAYYLQVSVGDASMVKVFLSEQDLHTESAKGIFGVTEPTSTQRYYGKTTNFLTVYGGGAKKLAATLDIPLNEAQEILAGFHRTWPGVKKLAKTAEKTALYRGYVKTLLGRPLSPPKGKEYTSLNTIIQGSAAEILKMAMVNVHRWIKDYDSHMVLSIHDEIGIDAVTDELPDIIANLPLLMRYEPVHRVCPIEVEMKIAVPSWADKMSLEEYEKRNKATLIGGSLPT